MNTITLDGDSLTIQQVVEIARNHTKVCIAEESRSKIVEVRQYIDEHWLKEGAPPVYGFNTGVGKLKDYTISQEDNAQFQKNIVNTHCGGIGEPASEEIVRAMMVSRINAHCLGVSGLRIEVVDRLTAMLNAGVHPVVPIQGSVGASGDLAPLAHMVSVLVCHEKAEAFYNGERMSAESALTQAGITPVQFELKAKDCLALINGNNLCAAMAALNIYDSEQLMKSADIAGALSLEAIRGEKAAFDHRIHEVRKQPGQIAVAENIRRIVEESQRTTDEARQVRMPHDYMNPTYTPRVQDQYSFRCLPQVHGSCKDNLDYAKTLIERELNAATDNPLVFWNDEGELEFLSGGNFHCEPIAFAMDLLTMSLAEMGSISERRLFTLCDSALSYGLPPNLSGNPIGLNTGYAVISCAAASVVSENKTLCFPAVADTIPTKSSQEDHVSMAAWACRKTRQVIDNLPKILGIEYLLAARAIYITDEQLGDFTLGKGSEVAYKIITDHIAFENNDSWVPEQSSTSIKLVESGDILQAIEESIGALN